jgi:hypothetical protein
MIEETLLRQLVEEFKKPRAEFGGKSYVTRRRDWFDKPMKKISPLLKKESLSKLTINDAKKIYKEMTVGGPQLYPRSFVENGIEKIKGSLDYLLYGKEPIEQRFFKVVGDIDSEHFLKGVGRAFASTALLLFDCDKFGIWNGAIEGGLKKLGLLPKKERGEHIGQTYVKIVRTLKDLQTKCGFKDLSITDEFVELIYHGKIGEKLIKEEPVVEETAIAESVTPEKERVHLKMQWMLVKIGLMEGNDVWVATNDSNKEYDGEKFRDLCLRELPHFAGPDVLKIAQTIDVIWFKKRSNQPVHFFEVEHTTSIYSGLLRLNDVKIDYPIPKAAIVADSNRKSLFESQISRRTFVNSELGEVCGFLDFKGIKKLFESEKIRHKILR